MEQENPYFCSQYSYILLTTDANAHTANLPECLNADTLLQIMLTNIPYINIVI